MNSGHGRISMSSDAEEGSFLGLGFFGASGAASGAASNNNTSADALMKHYLQQCLSYHEEQLRHDAHHEESVEQVAPTFVAGAVQQDEDLWRQPPDTTQNETSISSVDPSVSAAAQEAIAKARSIVEKFQTQQQQQHEHLHSDPEHHQLLPPAEYARRRHAQLEKEKQRLENALYKNFEYVSHREQERYQQQLLQLQQTRQMEIELQQQHAQQLLERQKQRQEFNKNQSLAGVGSTKRKHLEQQKQRKRQRQEEEERTASVYISGMPTDGSVNEDTLLALFGSYGALQRIHLYRSKQTKDLKGDGLLVYSCGSLDDERKKGSLVDTVCSQMNGAELPCGSILRVEPATSNYKNDGQQPSHYGPAEAKTTCSTQQPEQTNDTPDATNDSPREDAGQDLDDFFASLT